MTNWQPKWASGPNPIPGTAYYDWVAEGTGETLLGFEVEASGLIRVMEDDWLSKYTAAIYGDFDVHARFLRINLTQKSYDIIQNTDLIYSGETLLHVDSFLWYSSWRRFNESQSSSLPDQLPAGQLPAELLAVIQSWNNWTTRGAVVDAIGWVLEFLPISPLWSAAFGVGGLALGLYSAAGDWVATNVPALGPEKFYAILYTMTAWVYDETSETDLYPATGEYLNDPEIDEFVPRLPYHVPQGVADPRSWMEIHGYFDRGMSENEVKNSLRQLKNAWEETSGNIIRHLEEAHWQSNRVLVHFRPLTTVEAFKEKLRSIPFPGPGLSPLEKAQFFQLAKKELLKTWEDALSPERGVQLSGLIGTGNQLRLLKALDRKYTSLYSIPK